MELPEACQKLAMQAVLIRRWLGAIPALPGLPSRRATTTLTSNTAAGSGSPARSAGAHGPRPDGHNFRPSRATSPYI